MKRKKGGRKTQNIRVAGATLRPNGVEEMFLEPVRSAKGFGRWIYCKYCYKSVKPMLSGINQIVCSECGAGLTPDFFSLRNLRRWLAGNNSALKEDLNSKEAEVWLREAKEGRHQPWKLTQRRLKKSSFRALNK